MKKNFRKNETARENQKFFLAPPPRVLGARKVLDVFLGNAFSRFAWVMTLIIAIMFTFGNASLGSEHRHHPVLVAVVLGLSVIPALLILCGLVSSARQLMLLQRGLGATAVKTRVEKTRMWLPRRAAEAPQRLHRITYGFTDEKGRERECVQRTSSPELYGERAAIIYLPGNGPARLYYQPESAIPNGFPFVDPVTGGFLNNNGPLVFVGIIVFLFLLMSGIFFLINGW